MRIGIMMAEAGASNVADVAQNVADLESDGFDAVWFGQIFGVDALTVIALAGQRTSRIGLGTAVVPTYPRHPFVMAQQALTVQSACGGRFTLGVGLSHHPVVEGTWGLSYERPARHMREYLSVLRPLLQEGKVAFSGALFRTNGGVQVPGAKPTPVLIAALAPTMLKIAGTLADGTITWMTGVKTIESHIVPSLTAATKAAGRSGPRVVVGLPIAVTDDADAARERAARTFVVYGQLPNYRRVLDREGVEGPKDVVIVGDEKACERQLRELASAGATDLCAAMFPAGDDARASLARTREFLKGMVGKV